MVPTVYDPSELRSDVNGKVEFIFSYFLNCVLCLFFCFCLCLVFALLVLFEVLLLQVPGVCSELDGGRPPRVCGVQVVRYLHDEGTEIAKGEAIP